MKPITWGILGCGGIAHKFCASARASRLASVSACASRTPGKAAAFASAHGLTVSYDNYGALLQDATVDAIYLATTHNFHYENLLEALQHGKPVLCEKPLTVNATQAREAVGLARANGVFLMEGMWTRFLPAIRRMKAWLDEQAIGKIRMLRADFCHRQPYNPENRFFNPALAGGALLDAGVYPISMASHVFGKQPEQVAAFADRCPTGVDVQSAYLFNYADGSLALLSSAVVSPSENRLEISGSKGRIIVPSGFLGAAEVELHLSTGRVFREQFPHPGAEGFRDEIDAACEAIANGQRESELMPLDESVAILETMDRCREAF